MAKTTVWLCRQLRRRWWLLSSRCSSRLISPKQRFAVSSFRPEPRPLIVSFFCVVFESWNSRSGGETMSSKVVYEGWMVRYGRRKIGRSFIHMRYFVLESRLLAYYKRKPQDNQVVLSFFFFIEFRFFVSVFWGIQLLLLLLFFFSSIFIVCWSFHSPESPFGGILCCGKGWGICEIASSTL